MCDLREVLENQIRARAREYLKAEDIKALCSAYADVCAGYEALMRIERWGKWDDIRFDDTRLKEDEQS